MKGNIVCATRAGEGSRTVQQTAVTRAIAEDKQLIFLYVSDPNSLEGIDEATLPAVRAELNWMGQTLLRIAERRAHNSGLEARLVLREGSVRDEICSLVTEVNAELLLLGAPRGTSTNVFGNSEIEQFAAFIHDTTGVKVQIVRPAPVENDG